MPRLYDDDDEARRPILQPDTDTEESPAGRIVRQSDDDELSQRATGCGASACCNPSSAIHRFMALILMCLVGFGKLRVYCSREDCACGVIIMFYYDTHVSESH